MLQGPVPKPPLGKTRIRVAWAIALAVDAIQVPADLAGPAGWFLDAGLDLITMVRQAVSVPIIASGGAGRLDDFVPAVTAGADAVLAASVFHFGTLRIGEVKDTLRAAGLPVR